jgi:hypothetical protein
MTETKKIQVSKRAAETRIKRELAEQNKKLKKKGDKYIVVDLKKGGVEKIYDSFAGLINSLVILHEWEEIEEEGNAEKYKGDVSMSEVAHFASHAALTSVISKLGAIGAIDDSLAEDIIDSKVYDAVLQVLKEIKNAGAHPETINLVD